MHAVVRNGVAIVRTASGVAVAPAGHSRPPDTVVKVEVDYQGRRLKDEYFPLHGEPWRDYFSGVDMLRVCVRVKDGETVLAELGLPPGETIHPFMVRQVPQFHETENSVSVPPALTITDERGDVWTLGFGLAPKEKSPKGEFAFPVLRNGVDTGEVASRIEMREGRVRAFTKYGWRVWVDGGFFF